MSEIEKTLKRVDGFPIKVITRGGKIVKILAQTIELPPKDNVKNIFIIEADITEEREV